MPTGNDLSISVVIPAYNAGPYIAATLQSVLAQQADNIEVVIVDGGSTDDTVDIANTFSTLNITIISEPDRGQLDALQKGLKVARNDIILWLNADDIVMPGAFSAARQAFSNNNVDFVYSDDVAFNERTGGYFYGPPIDGLNDFDHYLYYRQMYSECVYWKRSITRFLQEDAYSLRVYTDYAFFLRLRWGRRGMWLNQRLGAFRIREGQASAEFQNQKVEEYKRVKEIHRLYIGWPEQRFVLARIVYWPWFLTRQRLRPEITRACRRLTRAVTKDRKRKREADDFFNKWLLPMSSKGPRSGD